MVGRRRLFRLTITNHSGHFQPPPDTLDLGLDAFAEAGSYSPRKGRNENMADVTLDPEDLIDHARRDTFTQDAIRVLETGMRKLRLAREAGEMANALQWWSAVAALNRALTEHEFIDEVTGLERESRLAAMLADTFGKERIASAVDFDDIATRTMAALPISYEWAAKEALHWTELPREEILRLRYAKEIIGALEQLEPYAEQVTRMPHWDDWRELKPRLP